MKIIEVKAKEIFAKTKLPGCDYVINQYVGCQHACKYCYAKFISRWKNYGKWGSWVEVKVNAPELVRDKYVDGIVYMSSISDPYQPIEEKLNLTRRILENMDKRIVLAILTKSKLVTRDIDVFKNFKDLEVGLTINDFDGKLKNEIEPFSSKNSERMDALLSLKNEKIKNYAFISPVIPKLTDVKTIIKETKNYVDSYWVEVINLRAAGREFVDWLKENYPESYEIMVKKDLREKFIEELRETLRDSGCKINALVVHHPKFKLIEFKN